MKKFTLILAALFALAPLTHVEAKGPKGPKTEQNSSAKKKSHPKKDTAAVKAIKKFQRDHDLRPDGIVGPDTRRAQKAEKSKPAKIAKATPTPTPTKMVTHNGQIEVRRATPVYHDNIFSAIGRAFQPQREFSLQIPPGSYWEYDRATHFTRWETKKDRLTYAGFTTSQIRLPTKEQFRRLPKGSILPLAVEMPFDIGKHYTVFDKQGFPRYQFVGVDRIGKKARGDNSAAKKMALKLGYSKDSKEYRALTIDTHTESEIFPHYWGWVLVTPNPNPIPFRWQTRDQQYAAMDPAYWTTPHRITMPREMLASNDL